MPTTRYLILKRAIAAWNVADYFTCHDILEEEAWHPCEEGLERLYYHGLIQLAVGFTHWQRGNAWGTRRLLERGFKKVEDVASESTGGEPWQQALPASVILHHLAGWKTWLYQSETTPQPETVPVLPLNLA